MGVSLGFAGMGVQILGELKIVGESEKGGLHLDGAALFEQ